MTLVKYRYNIHIMKKAFQLDPFQKQAIEYAHQDNSLIVSAPTGAGKTLIAEYIIEDCMKRNKGVIYTAPIKALSNQKFRDFSHQYPKQTGIVTGDVSINRNAPILIMTTEIFRNAILIEPENFAHRDWVIFDEIHYLDDIERGTVWEETIILLPAHMRMLALSATLPNLKEFTGWLNSIHKFPIKAIIEETRPVPLHFFFQCNDEIFPQLQSLETTSLMQKSFRKNMRKNRTDRIEGKLKNPEEEIIQPVKKNRLDTLVNYLQNKQAYPCIYFCFSRRRCEDLAEGIAAFNFLNPQEKKHISELFDNLLNKFQVHASPHINFLTPLIKNGIAYHHAGLLPGLKEIIEQLFTSGLIKFIFTTETFALGINMPAKTVIFDALRKFYGRFHSFLKTRDFYQMAGRAGRRGLDDEGYVISRIHPDEIDLTTLNDIIYGQYEPIKSQLNSCYATILNLYKIMGEKIYDIYPSSFHYIQANSWEKKTILGLLQRKISLLKELKYIAGNDWSQKGELAAKVYSFELPIGQLFETGFLNSLDPESLFTSIVSLVYEPRKGEKPARLTKKMRRIKQTLINTSKTIHSYERKFRVSPLSKRFYFHLSEAASLWFQGADFSKLHRFSTVDEGEIVRYFRMALQVLREMRSSTTLSSQLRERINIIIRCVNRDVIDARKQLGID